MFNTNLTADSFSTQLLRWFADHGRHDLPWQHPRSPYRVWLAEIMLQQTQVQTVIGYFNRFVWRFPELSDLAAASTDEVMQHWAGLGYYARARNLHKTAQIICLEYGGQFPQDPDLLQQLPGIGRSTAAAILAQAFAQRHAILDGNVKRVLCRYHGIHGWPGERKVQDLLWQFAEQHTPATHVVDYTQAIMDMGATLCTRTRPRCVDCPVNLDCYAHTQNCVSQLPTGKPRQSIPVRSTRMLVLRDAQGRVLLEKRPPSGIWGGLWSLPETTEESDLQTDCQRRWGITVDSIHSGIPFRHTFSHYHLDITPLYLQVKNPGFCVMEEDRWLWYNNALSERPGLPAPVTAILDQLYEQDT
ncbi:MAG TPA: A/G-specific adenine glycosylase [Gammaproteobacteria bacterium]|nr:A/G-specific adenine glycosylase [Gammaproteobacteria bacterium]